MYSFTKHSTIYTVIDKVNDYTIIHRDTGFEPWIVAYGYDEEDNSWMNGYYCDTLENAIYTALKDNFWSKDWILKDQNMYLIAIKRETEDGIEAYEEWVETYEAKYEARFNRFYCYGESGMPPYVPETEIIAAIPIADPYDLLF